MSLYKSVSEYHLLLLGCYIHFKLQHSSFTMVNISFYAWILDSVTMNNSMTNDFDNMQCLNWFIIKFYDNFFFCCNFNIEIIDAKQFTIVQF